MLQIDLSRLDTVLPLFCDPSTTYLCTQRQPLQGGKGRLSQVIVVIVIMVKARRNNQILTMLFYFLLLNPASQQMSWIDFPWARSSTRTTNTSIAEHSRRETFGSMTSIGCRRGGSHGRRTQELGPAEVGPHQPQQFRSNLKWAIGPVRQAVSVFPHEPINIHLGSLGHLIWDVLQVAYLLVIRVSTN